jgi:ABC-type sugar transport system ATPase subunit
MSDPIVSMDGIVKIFAGVHALDRVHFDLRRGEVHALIGENGAGKSTLMKILLGIYQADRGTVVFDGGEVHFKNPAEALGAGISMIHQEISLVPGMTVAENIWLGRERLFRRAGIISNRLRLEATKNLLSGLNLSIDPRAMVRDLSVASMQLVEMVRAVSYESKVIIMDEPTSALTNKEIELLYGIIRSLADRGTAIIFISHKLEEIFKVCGRVTVLRDGGYVGTRDINDIDMAALITMIVGRKEARSFEKTAHTPGETVLEVRHISQRGVFEDVSFSVRRGEVLGFAGLMGAGRTEIMQAVFGTTRLDSGEVLYRGKPVNIRGPGDAVKAGIGMVTEDRLRTGSIYTLSVMQNGTLVPLKKIANRFRFFSPARERRFFIKEAEQFNIKYVSTDDKIGQLSGGNQQKVIFARWLSGGPAVLILDEPTRGIDVGSKAEIYRLIDKLASRGLAILLVSSEMPELLALSDRIMVVREGRIVFETGGNNAAQEELISHAFGVAETVKGVKAI